MHLKETFHMSVTEPAGNAQIKMFLSNPKTVIEKILEEVSWKVVNAQNGWIQLNCAQTKVVSPSCNKAIKTIWTSNIMKTIFKENISSKKLKFVNSIHKKSSCS